MTNFYVPHAEDSEQAERVYGVFIKNSTYPQRNPDSRLFSIRFMFHERPMFAEVGKEITHFPERVGEVLGIIETTKLVCIHTIARGGLSATPILVSPGEVVERTYFDDFPARAG